MTGINNQTGKNMPRAEHIRQSIADILFTPIGTRICREDYGSMLPELIDHPQNGAMNLRLAAASYMAIMHWEPRIIVQRITSSDTGMAGARTIEIDCIDRANGEQMHISAALMLTVGAS